MPETSEPGTGILACMERESDPVYEPLSERLIREAIEAGEFDDLPGTGKPVPGAGRPDDDLWWVRAWMKRSSPDPRTYGPQAHGQRPERPE